LRGEYKVLRAQLPSGRHLHYIDPQIEESEFSANGKTFKKDVVTYMGVDQQTRQWVRQHTRGGHLTENFCQAVARDILLSGLILAEANGMPVVAHVHDEIICEVPDDGSKTVEMLADCMKTVPTWAAGLPLDAAGFSSKYYKKE
jgi:DNA polymerase